MGVVQGKELTFGDTMTATAIPNVASSVIGKSIQALYGVATDLNAYIDKHIEVMEGSDNHTIARTGRVLEAAKYGFGIGYISSVVIVAAGQLLLGNPLSALVAAGQVALFTNPIAMTCAAVGAIFYGWNALSDVERAEILDRLSKGLEIGVELIKSVVRFVIDKTKEWLSSEDLKEIKAYVSAAAAAFGRTLSDVTRKVADVISDTAEVVRKRSGEAAEAAAEFASETYTSIKNTAGEASGKVRKRFAKSSPKQKAESSTGNVTTAARLEELQSLLEQGLITQDEYDEKRRIILKNM